MPATERRAALQPYLDEGLTRSQAYQCYLASPAANQPTESQRNQQRSNVETRAPVTPLQRTLRRAVATSTAVKPTAPKPAAKRASVVTTQPLLADTKPSKRLATMIRSARQRRAPRAAL
jgi:hypothetical protein